MARALWLFWYGGSILTLSNALVLYRGDVLI